MRHHGSWWDAIVYRAGRVRRVLRIAEYNAIDLLLASAAAGALCFFVARAT